MSSTGFSHNDYELRSQSDAYVAVMSVYENESLLIDKMGINQLSKLIDEYASDGCQTLRIEDFKGKRLAIDVSNYMYQFAYNPQGKKPNYHIAGFFHLVYELACAQIMPVMVLDGNPNTHKKEHVLVQRKAELERKKHRITELTDSIKHIDVNTADTAALAKVAQVAGQVVQQNKQIINVTAEMWNETIALFDLMGVPVMRAEGEADVLAAQLTKTGHVAGIISEDMDHLIFGGRVLIRDFNNKRDPDLTVYNYERILQSSGLTADQLIQVAILCGCDYTEKISGIAWKTAFKLIRDEKETIDSIIRKIDEGAKGFTKYTVPDSFLYKEAQELFKSTDASYDERALKPTAFKADELKRMLMSKCNYRDTTLTPKFDAIRRLLAQHAQTNDAVMSFPKPTMKTV